MNKKYNELLKWGWSYFKPFAGSVVIYNGVGFLASLLLVFELELSRFLIDSMTNPNRRKILIDEIDSSIDSSGKQAIREKLLKMKNNHLIVIIFKENPHACMWDEMWFLLT